MEEFILFHPACISLCFLLLALKFLTLSHSLSLFIQFRVSKPRRPVWVMGSKGPLGANGRGKCRMTMSHYVLDSLSCGVLLNLAESMSLSDAGSWKSTVHCLNELMVCPRQWLGCHV